MTQTVDPTLDALRWMLQENPMAAWVAGPTVATLVFLGLLLLRRLAVRQLAQVASRTATRVDSIVVDVLRETRGWFLFILAVRAGSLFLALPPRLSELLATVTILLLLLQAAVWGNTAIRAWLGAFTEERLEEDAAAVTTMRAVVFLARVGLWSVVLLTALHNLGINVTAVIAGLGVGGIAVALAIQNILGDLFASLSIVIDKPFVVGDFIIVGELLGTVEHIGLKTTRVRSLGGEQLIFSNSDLLNSRIRNFKRMQERRVVFSFGVTYGTGYDDVRAIPGLVRELIEGLEGTRFDRAHFKEYGESSLVFEVVYHVLSADFNVYMDIQQEINLGLMRAFRERGVAFAYPTRTLYLASPDGAPRAPRPPVAVP